MENVLIYIKSLLAAVGGVVVYWLGGLDRLLIALVAVIILDYATGLLAAWHNKELSSAECFRGIRKKTMLMGIVALAFTIEDLTGGAFPLREITIMFFVVNEAISILENAAEMDLPVPDRLKDALAQLKGR